MPRPLASHAAAPSQHDGHEPPSPSPLTGTELEAWRGLLQLHAKVTAALDAEMQAEHGFPASTYEVLMFLGNAPGHRLRMAEIADRVLLTRSGCTRLVDRLVKLGYVTRSATPQDGRGFFATLTPAGADVLESARRTHYRGVRRTFLAALTDADQQALADIWKRALQAEASAAGSVTAPAPGTKDAAR